MTTFTYSTYLSLTNDVLAELNEVLLTSGTFSSAVGFQSVAKNAVNKAVRSIQNQQWEWPFNHTSTTQILTPGVSVYALPDNCKSVDWDTFFVNRDDALASPQRGQYLPNIMYDTYVERLKAYDVAADPTQWAHPKAIYRTQGTEFGVTPYPDQAYTIAYEYWLNNSEMVAYGDLCSVPDRFDYVIFEGAMMYCYRFRENLEAAADAKAKFQDYIRDMRNIYVVDFDAVTDRRVLPNYTQGN